MEMMALLSARRGFQSSPTRAALTVTSHLLEEKESVWGGEREGRQGNSLQRRGKAGRPRTPGLGGLLSGTLAESRVSVSKVGFSAPSASLVILGRAANLQNKIKLGSLRRKKTGYTVFLRRSQCRSLQPAQESKAGPSKWEVSFPLSSPLQAPHGPALCRSPLSSPLGELG